jgi:hypothetical protein
MLGRRTVFFYRIIQPLRNPLMSMLATIQSGKTSMPPRIFVYGTEGIGKSYFASQSPKPIFIQTEDGLDEIACDKFPLAVSHEDVIAALKELRTGEHEYGTVVLDNQPDPKVALQQETNRLLGMMLQELARERGEVLQ